MTRRAPDASGPIRADIPVHERLIADVGIRAYAALATPATVLARFRREAERALALASGLTDAQGRTAVRIRRFPGIEEASRCWSVYMTLDHLVMVNTGIMALIHALCVDHDYGVEIRHEDVRPHAEAGPDRLPALQAMVERYTDVIERLGTLRARERHVHPWFGPLTVRQWHALAAIHNHTHRVQVERILSRLELRP